MVFISCFGPAPAAAQQPAPVDILVELAGGSLGNFLLSSMPGSVAQGRDLTYPNDPCDRAHWSVKPAQNPQSYNIQIVPSNITGAGSTAKITISQGGQNLTAQDQNGNALNQPISVPNMTNGVASTADIWINLP